MTRRSPAAGERRSCRAEVLAPYVFRVAISDNRILECTDASVTYKYTPSGTKTTKTRTVDGWKCVRVFLQHVLPKGFLKVRYYGWMASNSRTTRDRVKWLVWLFLGWTYWLASGVAPQPRSQSLVLAIAMIAFSFRESKSGIFTTRPVQQHLRKLVCRVLI